MSGGIGKTQRKMLDKVNAGVFVSLVELTDELGISKSQAHRAARSLQRRGLVNIKRWSLGQRGVGEYGPLKLIGEVGGPRRPTPEGVPVVTLLPGDPWPGRPGFIVVKPCYWYRVGMPTRGLVLLPGSHPLDDAEE